MPERFIVIDGTKNEDAIEKQIWAELEKRLFKPASAAPKSKPRQSSPKLAKKNAPAKARAKKAGKR